MTIREFLKQFNIDVDTDYNSPAETLEEALVQNRINERKQAWDKLSQEEKEREIKEYCQVYLS